MNIKKIQNNKGFVILYAVMVSSIILAIALSVANISFKEIKFGTSTRNTDDAFFAADTGAECALFNDKLSSSSFLETGGTGTVECLGDTITLNGTYPIWSFILSGLGSGGQGCAKVSVDKSTTPVTVISKGYNTGDASCNSTDSNRVERELNVTYIPTSPSGPSLTASPSTVAPGDEVIVTFSGIENPTDLDWIGRYVPSADKYSFEELVYDSGSPNCFAWPDGDPKSSGSCTFTMPSTSGEYNFRIFREVGEDSYVSIGPISNTVTVTSSSPPSEWTLCAENEWDTCSFSGTKQVRFGVTGSYVYKTATNSISCDRFTFESDPAPGVAKHCDYASSSPSEPSLTASPSTVASGGTEEDREVTVTFSGIESPAILDWIGMYVPSAENYYFEEFVYDSGSPNCFTWPGTEPKSSGSCVFTMPSTPGQYNFRIFGNDGYEPIAPTSNTITVTP